MRVTTRIEKRAHEGHIYWVFVLGLTAYLSNGKILSMKEIRDAMLVCACRYDLIEDVKNEMKNKALKSIEKANAKEITRKEYRNARS